MHKTDPCLHGESIYAARSSHQPLLTILYSVVNEEGGVKVPHDTVIDELRKVASLYGDENGELSMAMAVYMLGFNTYMGFGDKIRGELGEDKEGMLKRIYEYVKRLK